MKKVLVSGCYDIVHPGHIRFFEDARQLGDYLIVCFASDEVLWLAKKRKPSMPEAHKAAIIGSIRAVDKVVKSSDLDPILDFRGHVETERPEVIAVTEDDKNMDRKREFCREHGVELVVLPKRLGAEPAISTTTILRGIKNVMSIPLRVDFAGGWLDVPRLSRPRAYVVNCSIQPLVTTENWPYEISGGLGGSAARAVLDMKDGISSELSIGVGWQDPAVITETGLCVWRSGKIAVLEAKYNPSWLNGTMLLLWLGKPHFTPELVDLPRDYSAIEHAGATAARAAANHSLIEMAEAVNMSYAVQLGEGMDELPDIPGSVAKKYAGGGHGGYALYLFLDSRMRDQSAAAMHRAKTIEPYLRPVDSRGATA